MASLSQWSITIEARTEPLPVSEKTTYQDLALDNVPIARAYKENGLNLTWKAQEKLRSFLPQGEVSITTSGALIQQRVATRRGGSHP